MIVEDVVEFSDLSLELDTGSAVEVRGSSRIFVNCTHIIVSILKAWKVTVVWIECDDVIISRKCIPEIVLSRKKSFIKILQAWWQTGL